MSWVSASGDEGWLLLLLLDEDGGLVSRAMFMYGRRTGRLYKGSCAPRKRRRDGAGDYDLKRRGLLGMSAGPRIPRVRSSTYGSEPFDEIVTKGPSTWFLHSAAHTCGRTRWHIRSQINRLGPEIPYARTENLCTPVRLRGIGPIRGQPLFGESLCEPP